MYHNKNFYIDRVKNKKKSYNELFSELKKIDSYNNFCEERDFYLVFKHIILSILLDEEIVLIDADLSDNERTSLLDSLNKKKISINIKDVISLDLIKERLNNNKNWKLTLFTSGTTGRPKSISHTKKTLMDNVRISDKSVNNVWGYAYNPSHMAGVQVFFQALLNFNTIVKLFNHTRSEIYDSIQAEEITHISATPTFYRLLLPKENTFELVKRVTFGGEKLSDSLKVKLESIFVNAKFLNIYASTEAGAIFGANGEVFKLNDNMQEFVKVKDNTLFIHKSKIGLSKSLKLEDDWYDTGDLVEVLNENPLKVKFLSRKNEMLNVGGYKVNPYEVEEAILSIKEVQETRVYGKPNSVLGNIVCADIVLHKDNDITKKQLNELLSNQLQDYKRPRIIKFLDNLEKTKTGKVKRG